MENFKVEYLVTVDQNEPFCSSPSSFNNLLRAVDDLTVSGNTIEFKTLRVHYEVQMGQISADKQRYFHLKLILNNEDQFAEFESLLKSLRTILYKASASGKSVQVLWDDIGFYYAHKAYPAIFEIENTLRKLITKFMLINVGIAWTNESMPQEVAESIRTKPNKNSYNYLYEADFIQLSNFLFKEYTSMNTKGFTDKIRLSEKIDDLNLEELKLIVPKSNWERYFSSIVKCESEYLRIRWEKLYERRNQVAHNKSINKTEFDEIFQLANEIKPKLQEAINKLDQITISEEDREAVAENVAENTNALYGEFLKEWKLMANEIYELALLVAEDEDEKVKVRRYRYMPRESVSLLRRRGRLNDRFLRTDINDLNLFRNHIVHEKDANFSEDYIRERINIIQQSRRDIASEAEKIKSDVTHNEQAGMSLEPTAS